MRFVKIPDSDECIDNNLFISSGCVLSDNFGKLRTLGSEYFFINHSSLFDSIAGRKGAGRFCF
jgi:hypothetical protein